MVGKVMLLELLSAHSGSVTGAFSVPSFVDHDKCPMCLAQLAALLGVFRHDPMKLLWW